MVVTINDVAKKAGVANSTVSKVLNNYNRVSDETKQKVLQAIQELNYVPNAIASALSSKKNDKIALLISLNNFRQAIDEINMQYLFGAFEEAKVNNLSLMTIFSNTLIDKSEDEIISYLRSEGIENIIFYGLSKQDKISLSIIEKQIFNIVVVDAPIYNSRTTSVSVDHLNAQYDVAKKLINNTANCNNILYLAGRKDGYVTHQRIAGIKKLQNELKLKVTIKYADFSEKKARSIVEKYGEDHDAIICASDLMAIGTVSKLKEMDVFRPCCGFDGITLMGYAGKGILTCKQDFFLVSKIAVQEMERLMNKEEGRQRKLDYEIIRLKYQDVIQ